MALKHRKLGLRPRLSTVKIHFQKAGVTHEADQQFKEKLGKSIKFRECEQQDCQAVVVFCPVSSRIGTDIDAALQQIPGDKPAVLVMMHHTYDLEAVVAESSRLVTRSDTVAVDCLFHETVRGLLRNCPTNERAIRSAKINLKKMKKKVKKREREKEKKRKKEEKKRKEEQKKREKEEKKKRKKEEKEKGKKKN
ncbi:uncharacterized protein [Lepisosteus oculatus]|uniref:uncharacterized protein n=1 Tax=Lepisosteus oculatus TaxID=7918 RepID=UPI0035F51FB2